MTEYIELEAFKAEILRLSTHYLNEWDTLGVLAAADRIPAADVQPVVRGRWIKYAPDNSDLLTCSECEKYWILDGEQYDLHFCPNCGAKMEADDAR